MSSCNRRWVLGAGVALAGCGFQPVHQSGGAGSVLRGKITLAEARTPVGYAFRERMRRKFGDAGGAADWRLVYDLNLTESGAAIAQDLDITRFNITGVARFSLISLSSKASHEDLTVTATASFDAIAEAFATRAARRAAETRLAEELAERASARLYALAAS
ncbi:MAG: LPS assembly lipoprotein LptE [Pikeienuella sp.]